MSARTAPEGRHDRDRCYSNMIKRVRPSVRGDQLPPGLSPLPNQSKEAMLPDQVEDKLLSDPTLGTIAPYCGRMVERTGDQLRGQLQAEMYSPAMSAIPPNINAALTYARPALGVNALSPEQQPMSASVCTWDERRRRGGPIISNAFVETPCPGPHEGRPERFTEPAD